MLKEGLICQVLEVQEEDTEAVPVTGQEEWDTVRWVPEADTCHHLHPTITDTVIDPIAEDSDAAAA